MTIPRGFGSSGMCSYCGEPMHGKGKNKRCDTPDCTNHRKTGIIDIPISKYQLGKYLFYMAFFGGLAVICFGVTYEYELELTLTTGIISMLISSLLAILATDNWSYRHEERDRQRRRELFFWAVPIVDGINKFRFKREDERL